MRVAGRWLGALSTLSPLLLSICFPPPTSLVTLSGNHQA